MAELNLDTLFQRAKEGQPLVRPEDTPSPAAPAPAPTPELIEKLNFLCGVLPRLAIALEELAICAKLREARESEMYGRMKAERDADEARAKAAQDARQAEEEDRERANNPNPDNVVSIAQST